LCPKVKKEAELPLQIFTAPKIYLIDNGIFRFTENRIEHGKFLEAAVLQELCKKGLEPSVEIFYWANSTGKEVDFVLREDDGIKQLIQLTYDEVKIGEREIRFIPLLKWLLKGSPGGRVAS